MESPANRPGLGLQAHRLGLWLPPTPRNASRILLGPAPLRSCLEQARKNHTPEHRSATKCGGTDPHCSVEGPSERSQTWGHVVCESIYVKRPEQTRPWRQDVGEWVPRAGEGDGGDC